VFGVFDLFHDGHKNLLQQAKKHASELMVIVARDAAVMRLKKRKPVHAEATRLRQVRAQKSVSRAFLGDRQEGDYKVLGRLKPEVICLGYDQEGLARDLKKRFGKTFFYILLKSYKPKIFKTSQIRKRVG